MMLRALLILATTLAFLAASSLPAAAYDAFNGVDCGGDTAGSAVCQDKNSGNPISGNNGALLKVANIVAYIGGAAAVIIIIISSIRYITSGGDPEKINSAKQTLIGAVIGLVIIVLAKSLITYVVSRI